MKKFILILTALIISHSILADEVSSLLEQRDCLNKFSPIIFEYVRINEIWLTNKTSALNIDVNFKELAKTHRAFLQGLQDYKNVIPIETGTSTQIIKLMKNLEEYQQGKTKELEKYLELDSKFLAGIYDIDLSMTNIYNSLNGQSYTGCPTEYKDRLERLKTQSLQWKNTFTNYRDYVVKAREKRIELFIYIYQVLKAKLKTDYKNAIGVNADKALKQIENILEAEKIQKEMTYWFLRSTNGTFLLGLSVKDALKELNVLTYDLNTFRKRIDQLEFLPLTKKSLIDQQEKYQRFVNQEISKREVHD